MFLVHVHVKVRPERVEDFIAATLENARNSMNEPGIVRFDVLQNEEDPADFILIEAYKSQEASGAHKNTRHYKVWRNIVIDMMAESRYSLRYKTIFP
jgi:quinol monooxygenase YgiN